MNTDEAIKTNSMCPLSVWIRVHLWFKSPLVQAVQFLLLIGGSGCSENSWDGKSSGWQPDLGAQAGQQLCPLYCLEVRQSAPGRCSCLIHVTPPRKGHGQVCLH